MSDYLPIVVAAPGSARDRLCRSDVLPHHLFHDITTEQMWEEHSSPSVYLWPYDIPYANSDELREKIVERVADVPAFFGMDPKEAKDHQERVISHILFGSVVVHILFLDNQKTDTTPGYEERNETYAQFCTFSEIVRWSRNLKQVMDVRFLNHNSKSHHILMLVSCGQQVVTTQKEIDELNELIGPGTSRDYKPFRSCYFLDLNLVPGASGKIFHSKYIWDVLIGRFLLALLLSQEKNNNGFKPLWDKNPGIKVWRASDCMILVNRDSSQAILKKVLEDVAQELQEQLADQDGDEGDRLALLQDVRDDSNSLDYKLVPHWAGDQPEFQKWTGKQNAKWSFSLLSKSFFCNWSDLPASEYEKEIETPEHWKESFEELKHSRISWCAAHPPADYTSAVDNFFSVVHRKPGELGSFIGQLFGKMDSTYKQLADKGNHPSYWDQIVAVEKSRQQLLKRLEEDSKEFKKAQNYYVGRGLAVLVLVAVTGLSGWIIWQVLGLFGVETLKILLLAGMVFAGGVAACMLVMILHNFTGNRAAGKIMAECKEADEKMQQRDNLVREMFFDAIKKRNTLTQQCVRFRTWLLAKRTLSILQTELQPQLSKLVEDQEDPVPDRQSADQLDPDHVRDAYLKRTRSEVGPIRIEKADKGKAEKELKKLKEMISGSGEESFLTLWKKICGEDHENAGYFPAKIFVSKIRGFVTRLLEDIQHGIYEDSIQSNQEKLKENFKEYVKKINSIDPESLLSASLPSYSGPQTKLLFVNSSFLSLLPEGAINKTIDGQYSSKLLETTRTAALFYQEFDVNFDLKPIPGSDATDSGQLTFKVK